MDYKKISKTEYINGIVKGVEKFKTSKTKTIVLDRLDPINLEDLDYIEEVTKLKVLDGKKVMIDFIPLVLKELSNLLKIELIDEEILVIGDDGHLTYDLVSQLSKEIRFLTVIGDDEKWIEDISKKTYDDTGLSIFYTENVNKILKNYSIIINLNEYMYIDIGKLRGKTIVFDLSFQKVLADKINKYNKNILVVEDFLFDSEDLIIDKLIFGGEKEIPSYKYEVFQRIINKDLKKVFINNRKYTLEDLVDKKIKNRVDI